MKEKEFARQPFHQPTQRGGNWIERWEFRWEEKKRWEGQERKEREVAKQLRLRDSLKNYLIKLLFFSLPSFEHSFSPGVSSREKRENESWVRKMRRHLRCLFCVLQIHTLLTFALVNESWKNETRRGKKKGKKHIFSLSIFSRLDTSQS